MSSIYRQVNLLQLCRISCKQFWMYHTFNLIRLICYRTAKSIVQPLFIIHSFPLQKFPIVTILNCCWNYSIASNPFKSYIYIFFHYYPLFDCKVKLLSLPHTIIMCLESCVIIDWNEKEDSTAKAWVHVQLRTTANKIPILT